MIPGAAAGAAAAPLRWTHSISPEVFLPRGVVVDAVEARRQVVNEFVAELPPDQPRQEIEDGPLQLAAVLGGVRLRPEEIGQIILPRLRVERQRGQIAGEGVPETRREGAGDPDVVRGDGAADAATAAVDEEPDARRSPFSLGLAAEFEEVIAAAEGAELPRPRLADDPRDGGRIAGVIGEAVPRLRRPLFAVREGDRPLDLRLQLAQECGGQIAGAHVQAAVPARRSRYRCRSRSAGRRSRVAKTEPTVAPRPAWTSGIAATWPTSSPGPREGAQLHLGAFFEIRGPDFDRDAARGGGEFVQDRHRGSGASDESAERAVRSPWSVVRRERAVGFRQSAVGGSGEEPVRRHCPPMNPSTDYGPPPTDYTAAPGPPCLIFGTVTR